MGGANMTSDSTLLDAVFGKDSTGLTPMQRAQTSNSRFVRSQHQLSQYRENASGRILNARQALRLFGWSKLKELADRPATPIVQDATEPYQSIRRQLDQIGVSFEEAARKLKWTTESIQRFQQRKQVPFRDLERISQNIDLDEELLGIRADAGADRELGVRLRTLKSRDPERFTVSTVLGLAEAAWTIRKQYSLAELIKEPDQHALDELGFVPSDDYGNRLSPDYKKGYALARRTRELLGISPAGPIESLKDLIETRLRIPVIQLELNAMFAGATVASGSRRGIAINLLGDNERAVMRRMTMAHELAHLLWDPDDRLQKLVVDRYDQITPGIGDDSGQLDHVERRANAFAIEFLAPADAILEQFEKDGRGPTALQNIILRFGVSKTAIARHLKNASHNQIDVAGEKVGDISFDEWEARELLAVPVFNPSTVPTSRQGRFAYYVLKAFEENLISDDTAASLYGCDLNLLNAALQTTRNYIV
jgi:Zn-dependent peptidase ImmA (M78 family)